MWSPRPVAVSKKKSWSINDVYDFRIRGHDIYICQQSIGSTANNDVEFTPFPAVNLINSQQWCGIHTVFRRGFDKQLRNDINTVFAYCSISALHCMISSNLLSWEIKTTAKMINTSLIMHSQHSFQLCWVTAIRVIVFIRKMVTLCIWSYPTTWLKLSAIFLFCFWNIYKFLKVENPSDSMSLLCYKCWQICSHSLKQLWIQVQMWTDVKSDSKLFQALPLIRRITPIFQTKLS